VTSERLTHAVAAIDLANSADPNIITVRGAARPKEQAHAEMMSEWIRRLRPDASEALLLAARAHHIKRWMIPRESYPAGRKGYLNWRIALHDFHAAELRRILEAEGYDEVTIARAEHIIRKRNLRIDADVQALEDALCLVFLETQFDELAARLDSAKMIDVLRKTLRKMSEDGKRIALTVPLSDRCSSLLQASVRSPAADPS
jgi:hypothetical protein